MAWSNEMLMHLTLVLVLIRVILNGAEICFSKNEYKSSGLFAWPVRRVRHAWLMNGSLASVLNVCFAHPRYLFMVTLQSICALTLLTVMTQSIVIPLLLVILAVELLFPIQNGGYGMEGSDQMHLILLVALTVYYSTTHSLVRTGVVWFIAGQSLLAYFTSGVVKLQTRQWREGSAIRLVLGTESYGSTRFAGWLDKIPSVSRLMCSGVLVFECGFAFAVLLGPQAALMAVLCGAFFHLMIAMTMGLNGFFWSFVATYPAVFIFAHDFQRLIHLQRAVG